MRFVAGVYAFGAVSREEVFIESQAGDALEHRHAIFFGCAGVYRRLVNDDIATLEHLAYGLARAYQWSEIGLLVFIDRRRHGDNEYIGLCQTLRLVREAQLRSLGEL